MLDKLQNTKASMLDSPDHISESREPINVVVHKHNWMPYGLLTGGIVTLAIIYFSMKKQDVVKEEPPQAAKVNINNQLERDPFHMI